MNTYSPRYNVNIALDDVIRMATKIKADFNSEKGTYIPLLLDKIEEMSSRILTIRDTLNRCVGAFEPNLYLDRK